MTEEQANLTRCCGPEGCGGNSSGGADRYCIASHCMAWRRVETESFKRLAEAEFRRSGRRTESNVGYCGLAGAQP